jgi:hypothetical protein
LDILNLIATRALRNQAITAVNKITAASGMKDYWEQEGSLDSWLAVEQGLIKRLE